MLARLAASVLQAAEDHVKALAIARSLSSASDSFDSDPFLAAIWRVLQAERQCNERLRDVRQLILQRFGRRWQALLINVRRRCWTCRISSSPCKTLSCSCCKRARASAQSKVCLIGCADMQIEEVARSVVIGATTFHEGDVLTLDGNNGSVYAGAAQT